MFTARYEVTLCFMYNTNQYLSFKAMHGGGSQSLECNYDVAGSIPSHSR